MPSRRTPPRALPFAGLSFAPRFAYGEMCELAEVTGSKDGTSLGTGFARFRDARIPWTIEYDEVLIGIEGRLTVHVGDVAHRIGPRDSLWLPKGTALVYEAADALVAYAVHPIDWAARGSAAAG